MIVYTSADSVFQIAAHEEIVPIAELYRICETARSMLTGEWNVSRVIARPFLGTVGNFSRTPNRRDYAVVPFKKTLLDHIKDAGMDVVAIGKISDIFAGYGITKTVPTKNNDEGIQKTVEAIKGDTAGLVFTNLVDFDSVYGHRRNYAGYANALMSFDAQLPGIMNALKTDDVLFITADHGCDPTFKGTDHTREYIPLLIYGKNIKAGVNIGTRGTFSDIGKTILEYLNIEAGIEGKSFLGEISREHSL